MSALGSGLCCVVLLCLSGVSEVCCVCTGCVLCTGTQPHGPRMDVRYTTAWPTNGCTVFKKDIVNYVNANVQIYIHVS
jgi:hypothetical protein